MNLIIIRKYPINMISFISNEFTVYNLIFSRFLFTLFIIDKLYLKANNPQIINERLIEIYCLKWNYINSAIKSSHIKVN